MPHCITDKFLLIVVIIGYGGPTMAEATSTKGDATQHEQQQEQHSCPFKATFAHSRFRFIQFTQVVFTEGTLHRHPCARVYAFEQAGAEDGYFGIDRTQVYRPKHTHVGGNGLPLQLASQQIVLESFQSEGSYFTEGERLTTSEVEYAMQCTAIDVCRSEASFRFQLLNNQVHVSG